MDFEDMITVLAGVQGTSLADGESLILNLEIDSRVLFLLNAPSIYSIFDKVKDECNEMDCVVEGPAMLSPVNHGDAWLLMAEKPGYVEGLLAMVFRDEDDGWAALQYTTTDVARAVSFGSEVIGNERLLSAVVSAYHGKFPTIGSTRKEDAVAHFCQMPAHEHHRNSSISAASSYVIDWFYAKGWRLYEALRWDKEGMETISRGPAKTLKVKTPYLLFPTTHNCSNPRSVGLEALKMRDAGQDPVFTSQKGHYTLMAVLLNTDAAILKLSGNRIVAISYSSLEEEIKVHVSGYDREAISASNLSNL